ncbi:SDR family oxidoreductase [Nisaea sediminum]|uniref:SDR family oxidoreductase n=1 Tax=Nisaea sediminum TaxID=2775867 RepID=UPI001868C37B|nr:SDR family NAD(P)-dependent oxidoreductase [Nisaea sediminum]
MLSPEGRVILVTGANRGIGLAIAKSLAARGYTLSLGARRPETIPLAEIGGDPMVHHWDAEALETSAGWIEATMARYGRIDGVVLNAGIEIGGSLEHGTEEEFDRMFSVNFKGPLWLARAALPHLRTSGAGRVINIASLGGKRVLRNEILGYSASKFAAMALTQAIRQSGWDDGVRATSVCPGLVETRMTEHIPAPEGQFKIEPETIAETVAYALSLPNSATVAEILVNSRYEAML